MSRQATFHGVIASVLLVLVVSVTIANDTKPTSMIMGRCSCTFAGHYYNLKSLASLDGNPRFQHEKQNWNYAYNPCAPFSFEPPCENVAACVWDEYDQSIRVLGLQSDVKCQGSKDRPELVYKIPNSQHWVTTIVLKCDPSRKGVDDGQLLIIDDTSNPVLQVAHYCCCPDACPDVIPTTAPHGKDDKIYSFVGGVIGGFAGLLLIAAGIIFYCRRRNPCHRYDDNRPLIVNPVDQYGAMADRGPDDIGPEPDGDDPDLDDDAPNPDAVARDPEGDAEGPEYEARDPEGDGGGPEGEDRDPEGDGGDPEGEARDPEGDAGGPEGEAPDPDNEAPDTENEASDTEDEASDPEGEAPDPDAVAPNPEYQGSEPDGEEASVPDDGSSNLARMNMRGESPHIADYVPHIPDGDLSHPIAVESNPEDQCCEEEASTAPREPVEHSL